MVDLTFMAKVLGVLPDDAQLVVLGDTPQLASVQPGAVFADVCRDGTGSAGTVTDASTGTETGSRAGPGGHSVGTAYGALADCGIELTEAGDAAAPVSSPLVSCVVRLVRNWRFNEAGGIGRLAAAVVRGDASAAVAALRDTSDDATELRAFTVPDRFERLATMFADERFAPVLEAAQAMREPGDAAMPLSSVRVL